MIRTERRTRIVATVGPSTSSPEALRELIAAGVDVVRLNASHADAEFFRDIIPRVSEDARALGRNVAILLDLRGPKIRVGEMAPDTTLVAGSELTIAPGDFVGDDARIPCAYTGLATDVVAGDSLLLDDGLLGLEVVGVDGDEVRTLVREGGILRSRKGINVPGRALSAPAFSEKDRADLEVCLPLGIDWVALSFVRAAADVARLRAALHEMGQELPIVAKIEKPQAVEALDEIIEVSDAIMVARGDLGVEVPPERVPRLQKRIIARCNVMGRPVITATQMLESMMHNPRPTRAEASDVANAIFDGTDAVMLSGETAAGAYPIEAVRMMDRIACEAESSEFYGVRPAGGGKLMGFPLERRVVCEAAVQMAREVEADCLVVYTLSGTTARVMSKLRPRRPVFALCPDKAVCRRLALAHGIQPVNVDYYANTDDLLREGDRLLLQNGIVDAGDTIVVVGGTRQFAGVDNMIQLRRPGAKRAES
jgi:pyruvate kinase